MGTAAGICQIGTTHETLANTDIEMRVFKFGFRPSTPRTNLWLGDLSSNEMDTSGRHRVSDRKDCMPCMRTTVPDPRMRQRYSPR